MPNTSNNKTPDDKRSAAQAFLRGERNNKPLVDTITKATGTEILAPKKIAPKIEATPERITSAIVALEGAKRNEEREDTRRQKAAAERRQKEQEAKRIQEEKDAELRKQQAEAYKKNETERKAKQREQDKKDAEQRRLQGMESRKQKAAALVSKIQQKRGKPINPIETATGGIKRVTKTPEKPKERKLAPLRTFTDDVTRVVQDRKQTLIKVRVAEQKKREEQKKNKPILKKQSKGHRKGIFILLLLVIFGGGGGYVYLTQTGGSLSILGGEKVVEEPMPVQLPLASAIIRPDMETNISVDGTEASIISSIAEAINPPIPNAVEHIYFTTRTTVETADGVERTQERANIHDVLAVWNQRMPDQLERSLSGDFMLGAYFSETGTTSPLLIMTPASFELTFTGMLTWEPFLQNDLERLFTTRFFESRRTITTPYQDMFLDGYNTRVLRDEAGNIGLIYSFIDEKLIVITTSTEAFGEIIRRLGV